jgi:hypothetical protein
MPVLTRTQGSPAGALSAPNLASRGSPSGRVEVPAERFADQF